MAVFTLIIEMGNDAMQSPDDIARALSIVSDCVAVSGLIPNRLQWIVDENGDRVGIFEYKEPV